MSNRSCAREFGNPVKGAWVIRVVVGLAVRPGLWVTALRQVLVLAVDGWWRRPPFLPVPDRGYLRFRMQTAYGDPDHDPEPGDVITYLHWCRAWPRITGATKCRHAKRVGR